MMTTSPERIGPWRILARLGAGGMGVVYRARHVETGELAALKTLRTARPELARALTREIRALARMRHPGVARFLGDGVHDGVPWYAMVLVEGETLDELDLVGQPVDPATTRPFGSAARAEASGREATRLGADGSGDVTSAELTRPDLDVSSQLTGPIPAMLSGAGDAGVASAARGVADLARVARVYGRLAAVLAWVHGEGVVHGDLKPANVVLQPGDVPVLVDFGLAGAFVGSDGRDALELGVGGGTVTYLSPEQIRGDVVDARADLYALGVMLFKALTGRAPFVGTPGEVVADHVRREPPRPSALARGVPPALDELVLGLLAKDPRDRIGHAGAVTEALSAWAPDLVPPTWPAPRPYLYRPGLVGRGDLEAWIADQLDEGRVGLVGGASGIGKTRLLVEAGRIGGDRDMVVLTGRALPSTEAGAGALHPLRGPLEQLAERHRDDPAAVFGERGAVLAPFAPAVPATGEAPPLAAGPARARLVEAVADTLRAAGRFAPTLVLLDDLHDADALTVDVLDQLARGGRTEALVVLGTWRTDHAAEALGGLLARPEVAQVRVAGLDAGALAALVTDMLSQRRVADALLAFLEGHAEGNPLFVAEYLRAAVERGMLTRDRAGRWVLGASARPDDIGVPTSIEGLLARRLATLEPWVREAAELASVLGRDADRELLAAVGASADALAALAERQVVAETATGFRFAHPVLRERLYAGIEEERRRGLHRAVVAALPTDGSAQGARAWHHEQAGELAEAAQAYLEAGRYAIGRYDRAAAEALLRASIRLAAPTIRIMARFFLAYEVLRPQGRVDEAREQTDLELAEARALGDVDGEMRALRSLAAYAFDRGRLEEARELFAQTLSLARSRGARFGIAYSANNLAQLLRRLGRPAEALPLLEEALTAASLEGMTAHQAEVLGNLASARHELGELEVAEALYQRAIAACRAAGARLAEAELLGNVANLRMQTGAIDAAMASYQASLAIRVAIGDSFGEAQVLPNYAWALQAQGALEEAVEACRRSGEFYAQVGDVVARSRAGLSLVAALHALGRHADAAAHLAGLAEAADAPEIAADLSVARARVARLAGHPAEARRLVAVARSALDARGPGADEIPWQIERAWIGVGDGDGAPLDALRASFAAAPAYQRLYYGPRVDEVEQAARGMTSMT